MNSDSLAPPQWKQMLLSDPPAILNLNLPHKSTELLNER
jgi:hypothetical protein